MIYLDEGFIFYNGQIEYKVIKFRKRCLENLALLQRGTCCPYVVARNVTKNDDGTYTWAWGHYFTDLEHAKADFDERLQKLL